MNNKKTEGIIIMKTGFTKATAWLLTILTVGMTVSACADETAAQNSATQTEALTAETEAVTEEPDPRLEFADVAPVPEDFGGVEFKMSVMKDYDLVFKQVGYWTEEQNGETLNDAIFARNLAVEEAFNVKTSLTPLPDTNATVRKSVQAGDYFTDIYFSNNIGEQMTLAQSGCLLDLNALSEMKLDQPWWDQRIQNIAINGSLYVATGDISIRDDLREMSVLYDKKLYTEFDYPDPYEFVANGTWTWDQMASMVRDVSKDLDGNGKMNIFDQWGLMSEQIAGWYLYLGAGRDSIGYKNGVYSSDIEDPAIYNIFENVLATLTDKQAVLIMDDGTHASEITTADIWTEATKIFSEDRALFRTGTFGDTVDLRDMKKDFGVLPIPKYTEEQKEYYCMEHIDSAPLAIPSSIADIHRTALVTEALAFESKFILTPKFYEVFLDEKVLRDEKSKEMIDILFDSKYYSLDYLCSITGLQSTLATIVATGKNNLASKTASIQKSAQKKLDKFINAFGDN